MGSAFQFKAADSTSLPIQKKSAFEVNDSTVQKKEDGGDVMGKMENSFGSDFSNVNIHKDSQKASDVGALAYTQGNDVHFAPGQFKPETQSGQELIGHELAHVVQQREGRVEPTTNVGDMPVNNDKGLESEADAMGAKAAAGESAVTQQKKSPSAKSTPTVQKKSADPDEDKQTEEENEGPDSEKTPGTDSPVGGGNEETSQEQETMPEEGQEQQTPDKKPGERPGVGDQSSLKNTQEDELSESEMVPEESTMEQNTSSNPNTSALVDDTEEKEEGEEEVSENSEAELENTDAADEGDEDSSEEGGNEEKSEGEEGTEGEGEGTENSEGGAGGEGEGGGEGGEGGGGAGEGGAGGGEGQGGGQGGPGAAPGVGGPRKQAAPQMGGFGKGSEPAVFVANALMAKSLSPDSILQDNGDGTYVVTGANLGSMVDQGKSGAPLQMKPDPEKDKPGLMPVDKADSDQSFAINRDQVQNATDSFKSLGEAEVKKIDDFSNTIPGSINTAATIAKGKVLAFQLVQRLRIEAAYLKEKATLIAEALRIKGEAQKALDDTNTALDNAATAAKGVVDTAFTDQEKALTEMETTMSGKFSKAFTDAQQALIDVATDKGKIAKGKGEAKANYYRGLPIPSQSTWEDIKNGGSFERDRHDARVKASTDTGNGYAAEFLKKAQEEGAKLKSAGEGELLKYVKDSVKAAKDNIKARKESAYTLIDTLVTNGKTAAKTAFDTAVAEGEKQYNAASASLDTERTNQINSINTTASTQSQAITDAAADLITNLQQGATDAANSFTEQITATLEQVSNLQNPPAPAIEKQLDEALSGITAGVAEVLTKLNQGVTDGSKSLDDIAGKAGEALAAIGDGAITIFEGIRSGMVTTLEGLRDGLKEQLKGIQEPTVEKITNEGNQAKTDMEAETTATQKGLTDVYDKLVAKFAENAKGLGGDFDKQLAGLDSAIDKQAQKAYDAVQPRWKAWLLFIVDLAIAIIVTAVICAALASGGILVALAVGAVAGAIGGALKYGAKCALTNEEFSWGNLGKEMVLGAVSGVITALGAGAGGAAGKFLVGKVSSGAITFIGKTAAEYIGEVGVGFVVDTIGTGITEVIKTRWETGKWDFSKFGEAFTMRNLAINFFGNLGGKYFGDKLSGWLKGGKEGAGEVIESTTKETVENTVETTAKETVENTVETTAKETVENTAETTAKETVENTAETTAKETVENTTETTAKETVENSAEQTGKETVENATEQTGKETVENSAEQTGKETLENSAEQTGKETVENSTEQTAKETTGEAAEDAGKKTGAELAEEMKYPDPPDGYHWMNSNGKPVLRRNPGKGDLLPPASYNPKTKRFVPDVEPPTGFRWENRDGVFILARKAGLGDSLPKIEFDPTTGGFKNIETGLPYISHMDVKADILAKIGADPNLKLNISDDEIKGLIDKVSQLGMGKGEIDTLMAIAARKPWVSAGKLSEVMDTVAAKAANNNIVFKDGWDFMRAWREGQQGLLSGKALSPEDYLDPTYIANHLSQFSGGASYLVPEGAFKKFVEPNPMLGRAGEGMFVSPPAKIDDVVSKAGGDMRVVESEMGFADGSWGNQGLYRIDVPNPQNVRIPNGMEEGANEFWHPGGITSGGVAETVVDQIPKADAIITKLF
ncbi:MAG: DUF4157 domain-containing protein [Bacteroidia bacterium]|nr:DUF4157 domain-containing protein [Bacteroidia bacterium]